MALWFLLNVLLLFWILANIILCCFGALASKIWTWMLSTLIKERIDGKNAPDTTFHYAFTTRNRQIRLLRLERSFLRIKATLISTYLDAAPTFKAISYIWGDPTATHQLLIDGHALLITRNAASVIPHLASPRRTRLLWLDIICVDQSSNTDRATQVRIMPAMYARASRVIVWIGDAPDADIAFD